MLIFHGAEGKLNPIEMANTVERKLLFTGCGPPKLALGELAVHLHNPINNLKSK